MYKLNNLKKTRNILSQRLVISGIWVFALRIVERAFNLVQLVILARILSPHDFGLMGIALLAMMVLETFSQTGFETALIQKKANTEAYLDVAWTVLILRGLLLFAILLFIAPYAAIFFKAPRAKPIIQVIGLSVLFHGFTNIGVFYFQKELEFNKQFIYKLSGILTNFAVAISAALILRSVWALVFGLLVGKITIFILSYFIHPFRPHLSSDIAKAKELFSFGKWILGSSILVFLITQGDDIFVGKLLGVEVLGFYQMAYRISNMPATEITHVISQVTFPAYSKLQDNISNLRETYLKVLQLTAFISFPITGLIFALAPDFTKIFLGNKWMPIVPAIMVLVFAGMMRSIGATMGPIFQAIGKPKIITKWQPVRLFVLVALIYPFTIQWGILGTSLIVFLSNLVSSIGFSVILLRMIKCEVRNFIKKIIIPLINTLIVILLIFIIKYIFDMNESLKLILLFIISILFYIGLTYILNRKILLYIKNIFTIYWRHL